MLKIQHLLGITLIHSPFTVALIVFNDPEQHQRRHFHPDFLNNLDEMIRAEKCVAVLPDAKNRTSIPRLDSKIKVSPNFLIIWIK